MILHGYFRSGTSYRTRIALNLKGVAYDQHGVDLREGQQRSAAFLALNPQGLVPALETGDAVLTQSPAILEWLEETHPEPPLLPADALGRVQVRAMAALVGCDIHPLNNLRVLQYLTGTLEIGDEQKTAWYKHWVLTGFKALEAQLEQSNGKFCFGNQPTLADCCLIPQVYNALRFNLDLSDYPKICSIYTHCNSLEAFQHAAPEMQPEAA